MSNLVTPDYVTLSAQNLNRLPVKNGQIITFNDADGLYYDMNNARHSVSGVKVVSELPATGQSGILYVVLAATTATASVWNGSSYVTLAGGGGITFTEMTEAQYNALTPTEKADGTLRFITDTPQGLAI